MAFLKTIKGSGRRGGCRNIERYLLEGTGGSRPGRCLAFAASDALAAQLPTEGPDGWAEVMDQTRRAWGKDGPSRRSYYHFVISPDPADHCGVEEARDVAREWATAMYPDAEWAVVVHDDNETGIPHAHVVVNAVYPSTGRMVHRTDDDVKAEARAVQSICEAHGLEALPDIESWRRAVASGAVQGGTVQDARRDNTERALLRTGRRSWVADMRRAVDAAVEGSPDWWTFRERLEASGYALREGRRGLVFERRGAERPERKLGAGLGLSYTREGIEARLAVDFGSVFSPTGVGGGPHAGAEDVPRELLRGHARRQRPRTIADWVSASYDRAVAVAGVEESLRTLATINREGISTMGDLDRSTRGAASELARAAERSRSLRRAAGRAKEVFEDAARAERMREELSGLPEGAWSPKVRRRRNELARAIAEADARCESGLSSAAPWLSERGYATASAEARARAVEIECLRQARATDAEVREIASRLESLQDAMATVRAMRPMPVADMSDRGRVEAKRPAAPMGSVSHGGMGREAASADALRAMISRIEEGRAESKIKNERVAAGRATTAEEENNRRVRYGAGQERMMNDGNRGSHREVDERLPRVGGDRKKGR